MSGKPLRLPVVTTLDAGLRESHVLRAVEELHRFRERTTAFDRQLDLNPDRRVAHVVEEALRIGGRPGVPLHRLISGREEGEVVIAAAIRWLVSGGYRQG
jgi:hypothetical protein